MADKIINSNDPVYSIIEEVTPGVTPVTGTRYELPAPVDQAPPTYSAAEIASTTKRPKRESNGTQRGLKSIDWSLAGRFQKAGYTDLLLKSGLSGKWEDDKLVASDVDTSFSVQTALRPNKAVAPAQANGMFYTDAGLYVSGIELSTSGGEGVTVSYTILGLTRTESADGSAVALVPVETVSHEFKYSDLKNVKLTGPEGVVDLGVSSLTFNTAQEKEIRVICGQEEGVDVGTSGARTTTVAMAVYRQSFKINTDVTGEGQELSFEVSRGGKGYVITLPAAIGQIVTDELSGSSILANLNFSASYDNATQCGLFIDRIG